MTDPIADMLTRIRNASMVNKQEVVVEFSKLKFEVAKALKGEGFIEEVANEKKSDLFTQGHLVIRLKYTPEGKSVINHINRISKPGQRLYAGKGKLPRVMNGLGTAILTTSKGILTDREARKLGTGGEILCTIW